MRHHHGVPIAGGHAAEQPFPVLLGEVVLVGYQDVGPRIEPVKLIPPLVQQVIGHHHHRLGRKAHALGLHDGGYAGHRLSCAHHMVKECRAFLNTAPDHIFLMRSQGHI